MCFLRSGLGACIVFVLCAVSQRDQSRACSLTDIDECAEANRESVTARDTTIDLDYVCVTIARSGAYGVGVDAAFTAAMSKAIVQCKHTSPQATDCGAQLEITRGRWTVAERCGDHPIIVTSPRLADALQQVIYAEIGLEKATPTPLPSCSRLVTVSPFGSVLTRRRLSQSR